MLLDPIAVGGMAELFRAKIMGDEGFQKLVAVKKILPHLVGEKALIDAFIDEARLAAFLQHENIVRTHDFGRMGNDYFIAMEFLFGKNLRIVADQAKARNRPLSLDLALHVMGRVARGLAYAHGLKDFSGKPLKVVHRDVSPANIFLTYDGEVKVVDFGVAKAASRNTATLAGVIKGKVAYMSPEQADGREIDHRSDIFAVGAVLYELLTGARMYSGDTFQILAKARNAEFIPIREAAPGAPEEVCRILDRTLAREPGERYQSCAEVEAAIEDALYALLLRPSGRVLSQYVRELFADELPAEEHALMDAAMVDVSRGDGSVESVGSAPTAYEKTEMLDEAAEARYFPPSSITGPDTALTPAIISALCSLDPEKVPTAHFLLPGGASFLLVPGPALLLGRKRDRNHAPAFLFPEEENEAANVKVSRNHCRISVKGRSAFIRDGSANGTFLAGKRLTPNQDVRLTSPSRINVGGILDLTATLFTDGSRIVCLRLARDRNRPLEGYILAPGPIPVGSTDRAAIRVAGVPRFLALVYYDPLSDSWRLRTLQGFSGPVRDLPLRSSQVIAFGPVSCRFEENR